MKKLLTILLLIPFICHAQVDKAVNDLIDAKIKGANFSTDTVITGVLIIKSFAGSSMMDTLSVKNNSGAWFELNLSGFKARCIQRVYISNTNGIYKVESTINLAAFSGMTGGSMTVNVINGLVVVKVTGNTSITEWKLIRQNL